MAYLFCVLAGFGAGVAVALLFGGKVISAVRSEFTALHMKFDAVLNALKK